MGEILLDNLSITRLPIEYGYLDRNNVHIQNYLYSLILWDMIICINEDYPSTTSSSRRALREMNRFVFGRINKILGIRDITVNGFIYRKEAREIVKDMEIENKDIQIAKDTIRYILLGYNLGVNICLSSERTNFMHLKHYDNQIFNRLDTIKMVEDNVKEFYQEINEKIGRNVICFQSPLLFDYICKEAKDFVEALEMAKNIKKEKYLIEYRRTMDEMEKCINEGNFVRFNEYLSIIPDIVSSIKNSGIRTKSVEIGLSPVPNISTNFDISFGKKKINKLHLRFLKDLAKFGITERIMKI